MSISQKKEKKMEKFQLKQMVKAAKLPVIIGSGVFAVGLVLFIIGLAIPSNALLWVGLIIAVAGGLCVAVGIGFAKDTMYAICPSCQKFMGETDEAVSYEISLAQADKKYDSSGKYTGMIFSYDCEITCPHCGNTTMFVHKVRDKNEATANVTVDKYIKSILKLKKKED